MACTAVSTGARALRAVCISGIALLSAGICDAAGPTVTAVPSKTTSSAAPAPHAATASKASVKPVVNPMWADLNPEQQKALTPLAGEWNKLDSLRKNKWLVLAAQYPKMKPDEQQRIHERMRDWAKLTPDQRRMARESYARAKKLNADQKSAEWQRYQNLPEDQKKKLADDAEKKKHVASLPRAVTSKNKPASASTVGKLPQQPLPVHSSPLKTAASAASLPQPTTGVK